MLVVMKIKVATARRSMKYWATGTLQPTLPVVVGPSAASNCVKRFCNA